MTFTQRIPADRLFEFVREGDTLRVVSFNGSSFVVQVSRVDPALETRQGNAREWLRTAKGSVHLKTGESADDALVDYYSTKYGPIK